MKKTILIYLLLFCFTQAQAQVIKANYYGTIKEVQEPEPFKFKKRHQVSASVSDVVFTNITLRYELLSKNGKMGFQIPFSFNAGGVPDSNNYYYGGRIPSSTQGRFLSAKNRIFQTGFNFNYYLTGQDKVSPYVGVSTALGWFYYWKYGLNPYNGQSNYNYGIREKLIANNYSFVFHAGFLFNPWEKLTFNIKGGVGLRRYQTIYPEHTYPYGLVDVSMGFKF